jgi:hypothetical protein
MGTTDLLFRRANLRCTNCGAAAGGCDWLGNVLVWMVG